MTPAATAFLRSASSEDLLCVLNQLTGHPLSSVDLSADEHGHRVAIFQLTEDLFLYVDVEKDVLVGAYRSTQEEVRRRILADYGGYTIGRAVGLGLNLGRYEIIPDSDNW